MSEVKEINEVVVGAFKLGSVLTVAFKDGVQAHDISDVFAKIMNDPILKQAVLDAYNDADKIPAEIKSLDLAGGIDIIKTLIQEVPPFIAALKA